MILTSMYTANLTAHLTLERSGDRIHHLEDLLHQNEYTWGMIEDRNIQIMMEYVDGETYSKIAERSEDLKDLEEALQKVKDGGFVFIDESTVLDYNFHKDCQATIVKTGKFSNHWAFGIHINSPYKTPLDTMLLRYREEGWLTAKFEEWHHSDNKASCSSSFSSKTKFGVPVLAGLFLILSVGILLSFVAVLLEILYVAHKDNIRTGLGFTVCLKKRLYGKYQEIKEEWFSGNRTNKKPSKDSRPPEKEEGAKSKISRNNGSGD